MTRFGFQEDQGVSGLWVVMATGHLLTQVVLSASQVTGPVSETAAEARQGGARVGNSGDDPNRCYPFSGHRTDHHEFEKPHIPS